MTIQIQYGKDNILIYNRIYRNVIKNVNFTQYVEGFFAQQDLYRWGRLYQLKGKEKILLRSFGNNSSTRWFKRYRESYSILVDITIIFLFKGA